MSKTYSFGLDFFEPKETELCFAPIVHIHARFYSKWGELSLITPECRSEEELNFQIDRLKDELEGIRIEAKKKFTEFKRKRDIAMI